MNINLLDYELRDSKRETINAYIEDIFKTLCCFDKVPISIEREFNKLIDFTYFVIMDICRNEGVDVTDIKVIGAGAFSVVVMIGNKVLKIGEQRGTSSFPNNPYIVAPLLRRNIKIKDFDFYVEVTEKADNNIKVSHTELYNFYKKFRDNTGLKMVDLKKENVGILLRDNKVYWNEPLYNDDKNLGLQAYQGNGTLKAGDLVILDADFIFDESVPDDNIEIPYDSNYEQFEFCYQEDIKKRRK